MQTDSEDDKQGQTLTNFMYGNIDEKGKLDGADYIPQVWVKPELVQYS